MVTKYFERVENKPRTSVSLRCEDKTIRASLEDISATSLVVLAPRGAVRTLKAGPHRPVILSFKLAPGVEFKTLLGTVRFVKPVGGSLSRIAIRLAPFHDEAGLLQQYLARRQAEAERQAAPAFAYTQGEVTSLYF